MTIVDVTKCTGVGYLRFVLFSKVHVRGNGFHISKLLLRFSCICDWFWFPPGCGSESKPTCVKTSKGLVVLTSRAIKTTERCTCHALMWWWKTRRSQAQAPCSLSSSPSPPLRLPIGRKNDPGLDPHHWKSSFKKHPKRQWMSINPSKHLCPWAGTELEPSWYEANTEI